MAKLIWDAVAKRLYEAGVDRGVLYIDTQPGVVWNGLISVDEKSVGDGVESYYFDGIQYVTTPSLTEFSASIEAFTYPEEFNKCDGSQTAFQGILITQQPQKSFGLSYRTLLGNDVKNLDYGYKIHLIYNALVQPSDRTYATILSAVDIMSFRWEIVTAQSLVSGYKPTASLAIDSTKVPLAKLTTLENILYGQVGVNPRLPLPNEVLSIFSGV